MENSREIQQAAEILSHSRYAVALTGAGISTPSGIPDFRGPGAGMWEQVDPLEVASIGSFQHRPQDFFAWFHPLAQKLFRAEPNPAHYALSALEATGILKSIITQNIDELHFRAGSRHVLEVHGHTRQVVCTACGQRSPSGHALEAYLRDGSIPRCECGGILKPAVVLFGEDLPFRVIRAAEREVARSDTLIVVGSSLEVYPVADFPEQAVAHGARTILINLSPTPFDNLADVVIRADVAMALPAIARFCQKER